MLEIGSLVDGKYKILNKVGQGGMSVVYLAMNEKANKQWAVKEVRKDGVKDFEIVKQGLVVETDMLKRLSHPYLPSIVDVIEDQDTFLIVMDYIQGNPLNKALDEYGAQPQEYVIEWAKQLCDVLGYLHTRTPAIIYRDMKPSNIMLKPDGNITLIDFGTAREYKDKNVADTTCLGTIGYAAPEQFGGMGQTDARTDIYCLGATLYHLVTGRNPSEPPYEILPIRQVNPALSSGLERIIMKCTQRNPEDRYQSCAELMYDLKNYEKIDDFYRKKQKRKLGLFLTSAVLTLAMGAASLWGYLGAKDMKSNEYEEKLRDAATTQEYYNTIMIDPGRPEAYHQFKDYLIEDFTLSKEEGAELLKLKTGLDVEGGGGGYDQYKDVLKELKRTDPAAYQEVCYGIGEAFLFYYEAEGDRARYSNAAMWFEEAKEQYPVAEIYCDMADCLKEIDRLKGAQVLQTEKLFEEYARLWEMLLSLKEKTQNFEGIDAKIQAWGEINSIINAEIAPLIEMQATTPEEMTALLEEISASAEEITLSVVQKELEVLQQGIQETLRKIETVKGR